MSEWLKEHAWKLILSARADAHQISPTHFRSTTSRNNDVASTCPLVNHRVDRGFRGYGDTVLTQNSVTLPEISTDRYASDAMNRSEHGSPEPGRRPRFAIRASLYPKYERHGNTVSELQIRDTRLTEQARVTTWILSA